MAKAKKLPSGSWRCLVYDYTSDDGKRHYKSFTSDDPAPSGRREAERQAAEFAYKKETLCRSEKTFGQALEEYISKRDAVVSPRTILNYRRLQNKDLKPLEDIKISNLSQGLIQEFVNQDIKTHAPKTVRDNHGLIAAVIKQERPEFALNTKLPRLIRPELYVPSDEDVQKLMSCASGTELQLPILLAAFGPMRRGEICALDTKNIEGNVVHVCKNMVLSKGNVWVIKQPKSYAGDRYIEYPDFVVDEWKGVSGKITTLTPDNVSNRFSRLLCRTGIPHFRFHDLRHYSVSIQHAIGIPDAYIMARGGWEDDGVLKNVYRHTMTGKIAEMNKKANDHFASMQHEMQHESKKA